MRFTAGAPGPPQEAVTSEVEQDPAAYAPSSPAKAGLDAEFRGYSCDACGKEFRWPAGKFKAAQAQHELAWDTLKKAMLRAESNLWGYGRIPPTAPCQLRRR